VLTISYWTYWTHFHIFFYVFKLALLKRQTLYTHLTVQFGFQWKPDFCYEYVLWLCRHFCLCVLWVCMFCVCAAMDVSCPVLFSLWNRQTQLFTHVPCCEYSCCLVCANPALSQVYSVCWICRYVWVCILMLVKNKHIFCHNFIKFPPTLTIFGTKMANSLKLYEVHSFPTSPNSRQRTTMLNADVTNCYITL